MLGFLTTRIGKWLAGAGALLMAFFVVFTLGKRDGRSQAQTKALKDSHKRQEKGRDAVQDMRGASRDDLIDRLRRNDGEW